jgi:hypothetical protein
MFGALFNDSEIEALFTDEAIIRAMLRFEAALVLAQADAKAIPFDHGHLTAWERLPRMSKEPVLQFETSGGSNAEPGAVVGGLFGALPNALRNAGARGVTDDTARTAREITAMVADYYSKNGGQLSGSGMKPKILAQGKR